MKAFFPLRRIAGAVVLLLWLSGRYALGEIEPSVSVSVDSIRLKDVGSDRVLFDLYLDLTSDTKLKTKRVQFEQMRLGTMPIYLSPISEHLELEKNVPAPLPPIPLTVFFRDLDSLAPLQQVVREGQARVSGNAHVDLDLNLIERLALRQWTPSADVPVAVTASIAVPGGFLGQAAASAALTAAQVTLDAGVTALSALRLSQRAWERELETRYAPFMVIAESRYTLRGRDGQDTIVKLRGLGFRVSEDKFILTGEMVQPWKYDPEAVAALDTGQATLVRDSMDLLVAPVTGIFDISTARSLLRGQIHVERQPGSAETTHVPTEQGAKTIKVIRRDTGENYAVLRFIQPQDRSQSIPVAPDAVRQRQDWERLAFFFVDHEGKLELVSSPGRRQNKQIVLDDPIDSRGFGSVLIAPEGAVGMVQQEHLGLVLHSRW